MMIDQVLKFTCDGCGEATEQQTHDVHGEVVIEMPDGWHCHRGEDLCSECLPGKTKAAGQEWIKSLRRGHAHSSQLDGQLDVNAMNYHARMACWVSNLRAKGVELQSNKCRGYWDARERCAFLDAPHSLGSFVSNCGDALENAVALGFDVQGTIAADICHMKGYHLWLVYISLRRGGTTDDAVQSTIDDLNEMLQWLANAAAS